MKAVQHVVSERPRCVDISADGECAFDRCVRPLRSTAAFDRCVRPLRSTAAPTEGETERSSKVSQGAFDVSARLFAEDDLDDELRVLAVHDDHARATLRTIPAQRSPALSVCAALQQREPRRCTPTRQRRDSQKTV